MDAVEFECDPHIPGARGTQLPDRQAVGNQQVVSGGERTPDLLGAGCVEPLGVADEGGAVRSLRVIQRSTRSP